jgi:hypothetical protein
MNRVQRIAAASARLLGAATLALLAACASTSGGKAARVYERETFDRPTAFSREFVASPADTCNAARRALLSQGYVVTAAQDEQQMDARKRFQPADEQHVQIEFHVVCSPLARGQRNAIAFVSAVQERYRVKKNPMSASVGVSPIGSISLPLASATDSLVKVGSETIPPGLFYDRFFDLVEQFLAEQKDLDDTPTSTVQPAPAPSSSRTAAERAATVPVTLPTSR